VSDDNPPLLIMLDRHLGNFLVASPVLTHIAREKPGTRAVINASHWALAQRIPGFPEPCVQFQGTGSGIHKGLEFLRALRTVRGNRPSWIADFGGSNTGALLGGLSGAPLRICRKGKPRAGLYNRHAEHPANGSHRIDTYGTLAQAAGLNGKWGWPVVSATGSDRRELEAQALPDPATIVCLHVAGGKGYKHWPLDRYAALCDWLHDEGLHPALVGAAPDRPSSDAVKALCKRQPIDLVQQLPLGALIALFERCGLFIGNDSGPMHLAAASGTHIIGLFGPTDPARWGPLTEKRSLLRGTEPVAPKEGKKHVQDGRRMDSIPLHAVTDAIKQAL